MHNFQRDGHMRMALQPGRVSYQPSMLDQDGPREDPVHGYRSFPAPEAGDTLRARSATFADHYSQARQFFISQTKPEQDHIVAAITFELSKVETKAVRSRVLSRLANIDAGLASRIAEGLGMKDAIQPAPAACAPKDLPASPALSILAKAKPTFQGRVVGCLVSDGADPAVVNALKAAVVKAGGQMKIVAPKVGGVAGSDGKMIEADFQLAGGPSVLFDAVALVIGANGAPALMKEAAARNFVTDAFAHLKVIGHTPSADGLLKLAGANPDKGMVELGPDGPAAFVELAKQGRVWAREPMTREVN